MASDGIEMRVALEFAKKLNMSVQLVVNEEEEWGDIYQNWTGTGIVGNLIFDRADIGFGKYAEKFWILPKHPGIILLICINRYKFNMCLLGCTTHLTNKE